MLRRLRFFRANFRFVVPALAVIFALAASDAHASYIYTTMSGATTGGKSVSARATFTITNNQVVVILDNLQENPSNVVQLLSGLEFHLSTGQKTGTLLSSSAAARTVSSNTSFSDGSLISTGWKLSSVAADLKLDLLGQAVAPEHLIIGPSNQSGKYSKADSSILSGHNPFLAKTATFTLNIPGVTSNTKITSATFQFNTCSGNCVPGCGTETVPEPASIGIAAIALAKLAMRRRR